MRKAIDTTALDERPRVTDDAAASLASYIAEMSAELAQLAARCELTMLAYFLDLARVEAEFRSRELAAPTQCARGPARTPEDPRRKYFRSTRRD